MAVFTYQNEAPWARPEISGPWRIWLFYISKTSSLKQTRNFGSVPEMPSWRYQRKGGCDRHKIFRRVEHILGPSWIYLLVMQLTIVPRVHPKFRVLAKYACCGIPMWCRLMWPTGWTKNSRTKWGWSNASSLGVCSWVRNSSACWHVMNSLECTLCGVLGSTKLGMYNIVKMTLLFDALFDANELRPTIAAFATT